MKRLVAALALLVFVLRAPVARAVTIINCQLCTSVSTKNNTCPKPTGLIAGQLLVVVVMHSDPNYGSLPSGWHNTGSGSGGVCGQSIGNGPNFIYLFYKQATPSDVAASSYLFTWPSDFAGGGGICALDYVAYTGTGSSPFDNTGGGGNSTCNSNGFVGSTTVAFPAFTTTVNNDLLFHTADTALNLGNSTITGPAGNAQLLTYSGGAGLNFWEGDIAAASSGVQPSVNGSQVQASQYNAVSFAILDGPAASSSSALWPFP